MNTPQRSRGTGILDEKAHGAAGTYLSSVSAGVIVIIYYFDYHHCPHYYIHFKCH